MRLIQKYLPNPRHTEVYRIFVQADPEIAWNTVRHLDMAKVPLVRFLFDIRTLPERLRGKLKEEDRRINVDKIANEGKGFFIAEEYTGKEVVVASVGKFWHLNIPFVNVNAEEFKDFNLPGYGKLAWNISVEPYLDGSTIAVELRTTATDELSWKKLNRYYHIIGIGSQFIRSSMMHHLENLLGKLQRPNDDKRILPGDERLKHCKYQSTHTIDIEAPASIVWRYLMQLGCDRAGWYSIDLFDHGGKPSVDHLVTGWETRIAGDRLAAQPSQENFFDVYEVKRERYFIIGGSYPLFGHPYSMTWSFILEPIGEDAVHLIARARMETEPPLLEWIWGNAVALPVHAIMQKVQLRNIKKIAERDAQMRKRKPEYERA